MDLDWEGIVIAVWIALLALGAVGGASYVVWSMMRTTDLEKKYPLQGGGSAFDAVFRPTAHDADLEWQSLKIVPVPAPSPDKGPGVIDFDAGRIEIRVAEERENDEGPA
ncbi:hypothetical protein [Microbacterium marinilacus]|uniref:hypothetical protein n=1 Tax=Microbacterium marinilacus TaxID=415209 RepID=UPI001C8D01D7|nr:hypothetical protein [Microbacterium marinilacus]MBY0688498.1 hypothetical protein [Microbacterium marinilacus]